MPQSNEKSELNANKTQKNYSKLDNKNKELVLNDVETCLETPETLQESLISDDFDHDQHDDFDHANTFEILKSELIEATKEHTRKKVVTFADSLKLRDLLSPRNKVLVDAFTFINSNPLRHNDFYKYLNCYKTTGKKLDKKYFRHDMNELESLYKRYDSRNYKEGFKDYNPFNINIFNSYVLFMFLKLEGHYLDSDDLTFNVKIVNSRIYNPISKVPTILRSCLPFDVQEFDISKAFPTFLDIELNSNYRNVAYTILSKKDFASALNANNESKYSLEAARKTLQKVYKKDVEKVLTLDRYNEKGKVFEDLTRYEKEYIELFVQENNIKNYVRLHDGVFTKTSIKANKLTFGKVEFKIKPSIKPAIINNIKHFYEFGAKGVETSPSSYADFLIQENFIRVSNADDKHQFLKDSNNVIDPFNYKTELVKFLESEICEFGDDLNAVRDKIAMDVNSVLSGAYQLVTVKPLIYYKDKKNSFGLPFKNGFHYFEDNFEIKNIDYSSVTGYFAKHQIQKHVFSYTDDIGDFELFIQRIATGKKDNFDAIDLEYIDVFSSMLGYYCHNYKDFSKTACVILTDAGANDSTRNGGRGKSVIINAIANVTKSLIKAGKEFKGDYTHNMNDLDKSFNFLAIDDVPASFDKNDLYTMITGSTTIQPKGAKEFTIDFVDSPKILVATNWLLRKYDNDDSTNRRFLEVKLLPYYNVNFRPADEFDKVFFQDWDVNEWNKFYSYIFRCVNLYITKGLYKIDYDKKEDNYKADFYNESKEEEMKRILDLLIIRSYGFTVSDFLDIYLSNDNVLRHEKMFNSRNVKQLITSYITYHNLNISYELRTKKWFNNDISK